MSKIVVVFTIQGQIVGEEVRSHELGVTLKNPVLAIMNGASVQMVPLTQTVMEKTFTIPEKNMMFDGVFTPLDAIANKYREIFGGVQIVQSLISAGVR